MKSTKLEYIQFGLLSTILLPEYGLGIASGARINSIHSLSEITSFSKTKLSSLWDIRAVNRLMALERCKEFKAPWHMP